MNTQTLLCSVLLPEGHEYVTYIKKVIRHRFRQSGFRRVTPLSFENKATAEKILGTEFQELPFLDAKGESLTLRTEPKLSIAAAYLHHEMAELPQQPIELYYIDQFYRRNSEGVLEETLLFGAESIGVDDPALDAQIISLGAKILSDLGLKEHFRVQINHLGCLQCRSTYFEDLTNFYFDKKRSLCDRCRSLMDTNPAALLRCREEDCMILAHTAPKLEHYLCQQCRDDFQILQGFLNELQIEFDVNDAIVGKYHFCNGLQFEFWDNNRGPDRVIISGGSSKNLITELGAKKPASMTGFECSMIHLMGAMKEEHIIVPHKDHLQVFVAQLGPNAKKRALALLNTLRDSGIKAIGAIGTGSMRAQLDLASKFGAKYTLLMGEIEVKEGMVIVRDMSVGSQESVPYEKAIDLVMDRVGRDKIDTMEDEEISTSLKSEKRKSK